jgi:serine protease
MTTKHLATIFTAMTAWQLGGCMVGEEGRLEDDNSAVEPERFVTATEPIPRRYIVVLEPPKTAFSTGHVDMALAVDGLAVEYAAAVDTLWSTALHGFSAEMNADDARAMSNDPRVAYVEEDGVVHTMGTQTGATWGLDRIDQASLPLSGSYVYPNEAANVTAYIIDTGIRTSHSSFGGRARHGFTAINDGRGSDDCQGHGTHVAGTVGSSTWGVAKQVDLVAVRVLGCNGSGSNSGVISGVDWVAQNASGPSVANMSLGGSASTALDTAIRNATNRGVTMVVAAGNENQNACNVSPARAPEAITVGSSTSSDARSSFSNWGTCVDIFAPGSNITSARYSSSTASTTMSGTSMAAPHVAGAAALYLQTNPSATPSQVTAALTNNATSNKLSGVNGSPNKLLYVGFIGGGGGDPPPPPPPSEGTPREGSASGSVGSGQWVRYQPLSVLAGSKLTVTTTGTGDPDLYIRFGSQPTTTSFHCRSWSPTATESCSLTVPAGQSQAYIGVYGYSSATFTLTASWVQP